MTTKVSSAMQDLTDDYAFSGTVSGAGKVVQVVNVQDGTTVTGTTLAVLDNSIIPVAETTECFTLAITPTNASNKLLIQWVWVGSSSAATWLSAALFQDATSASLAVTTQATPVANRGECLTGQHYMTAGTTSATTFKIGMGLQAAGTFTMNGHTSGTALYGGTMASGMTITEIAV